MNVCVVCGKCWCVEWMLMRVGVIIVFRCEENRKVRAILIKFVHSCEQVEWFNRTLKRMMWKEFSYQGTYKWINQDLTNKYNNRLHKTMRMKWILKRKTFSRYCL